MMLKTQKIYTVLELNNAVRKLIKNEFSEYVWVCGELQDFKDSKDKRHIYFNLVQKHPEIDEIIAKVSGVIFEGRKPQIFSRLQEADLSFNLKNDIEVKLLCEVDLYPKTGKFTLIVVDIDPIYTLGKIAQSRQRIMEDLRNKGLLDRNKLTRMPIVPLKIGLVTAYNSAAYHDFTNELKVSCYGFKVLVYNCHMQGRFVERDVVGALNFFNNFSHQELDVIVITRGGGSTADLSWFDNKRIAERIAFSKFPVISALGHQINITIADMVAHTFLKTPTKAAQFLVDLVRRFIDNLMSLQEDIKIRASDCLRNKKKDLETMAVKIDSFMPRYFRFHREELLEKKHHLINCLKVYLIEEKQELERVSRLLPSAVGRIFRRSYQYLGYINDKIKLLDPKNILKRGYSITFKDKKVLKSSKDTCEGDIIVTTLFKGTLISQVKKGEKSEEERY
jgi:exodeoxyribonuclease VII large subunit